MIIPLCTHRGLTSIRGRYECASEHVPGSVATDDSCASCPVADKPNETSRGLELANKPNRRFGDSSGWKDGVAATQVRVSLERAPRPFSRAHVVESLDRRGNWLAYGIDHGSQQACVVFRSYRKKLEVEFAVHSQGGDPFDAAVVARYELERGGKFNMLETHTLSRAMQADGWEFPATVTVAPA